MAGPEGTAPIQRLVGVRDRDAIACDELRGAALRERFPFFAFPEDTLGLHEPANAGHISPRRLVAAQGIAAEKAGAAIVRAEAQGVEETAQGVRIPTAAGAIEADRALVAAGGFSDTLLDGALGLKVLARTAVLLEVDAAEAERLHRMPTLIWLEPGGEDPYLLPPIRYPDGRTYIKMGGDRIDVELKDREALGAWFRSDGSAEVGEMLEGMVRARMPEVAILSRRTFPCVTTYTPENIAMIRMISDRVGVATAGCGRGAKCSDDLGRLGGEMITGTELPAWAREAAVA